MNEAYWVDLQTMYVEAAWHPLEPGTHGRIHDISPTDISPTDISPTDSSPTDISSKSPKRTFRQPYIFTSKLRWYILITRMITVPKV